MARYIVIRVESNATADELLKRFAKVDAIQTIGLFASATNFCLGKSVCGNDRKLQRSRKWGTLHCTVCKLPVSSLSQEPRNLLNDPDLHPRFVDLRLSIWEPYADPIIRYGTDAIERKKSQVADAAERVKRHKRRKRREAINHGG